MRAAYHLRIGTGIILAAAASAPAAAFDDKQFCQAMSQLARAATIDIGTWLDRTTRNDGVEVLCQRKLVHFKRTSSTRAISDEWKESKTAEWRGAYCASPTWREAVDNGWIVSATVTTAAGERVWFACQKGGTAFHRVIP